MKRENWRGALGEAAGGPRGRDLVRTRTRCRGAGGRRAPELVVKEEGKSEGRWEVKPERRGRGAAKAPIRGSRVGVGGELGFPSTVMRSHGGLRVGRKGI